MRQERQNERTTIHEVATLAGVSISTVSLVLADKALKRRISADTRARVKRAAEELNYAPNLLTRSLRRGRTHILSFFTAFRHREMNDQYMDKMSSAIETAGGLTGYDILVHCNFTRTPKEVYQFLNGGLADGLILFAPHVDDPLLPLLRTSNLPVVIIGGRDPGNTYPSVVDDVEMGMRLAVAQLIENGHRRIAALRGQQPYSRDAAKRVGLLRELLEREGTVIPAEWTPECRDHEALEVVRELLASPLPPTAIFCWHDRLAYKVLEACDSLGVDVPGQLSVIGYDGQQWPSATKHTSASVRVDLDALALNAVRLLDQYISGYDGPLRREVMPVSFLAGTSLGPAPDMQWSNT